MATGLASLRAAVAFAVPFANIVPFSEGLMAGEKIYFDLATLCEQARIPLEDVRAAAAVPAGGVGADPGGAVAEGNRRRAVVQLEDGSDLVGAQVAARDAVVSEQGAVAADDHPQVAASERTRHTGRLLIVTSRLAVGGARGWSRKPWRMIAL